MTALKKVLRRLKALREQSSLSQSVLAEALGINRSTYVRKELGYIPITTEEWIKIAERLNVKPGYFFLTERGIVKNCADDHERALISLYHSLKIMERDDLLTLIAIVFKGIKRKKVIENIARLRNSQRV